MRVLLSTVCSLGLYACRRPHRSAVSLYSRGASSTWRIGCWTHFFIKSFCVKPNPLQRQSPVGVVCLGSPYTSLVESSGPVKSGLSRTMHVRRISRATDQKLRSSVKWQIS